MKSFYLSFKETHFTWLLFIFSSLSTPAYSMVSCALLKQATDKATIKLIIIGDGHNLACDTVDKIIDLIETTEQSQPVHCIVEAPDLSDPRNLLCFEGAPTVNKIVSYAQQSTSGDKLRVIRADKRSHEERLAGSCLNDIILFANSVSRGELQENQITSFIEKSIEDASLSWETIDDFYRALENNYAYVTSLKVRFQKQQPALADFIDASMKTFLQARAEIMSMLDGSRLPLRAAIWKLFKDCNTLEKLDDRQRMIRVLFTGLSDPILELAYIEQFLILSQGGMKYIIFVVGHAHLAPLLKLCNTLHMQELVKITRLEEREPRTYYVSKSVSSADVSQCIISSLKDLLVEECFCRGCLKKEALQRCSACKKVCYCSVSCQSKDWQDHKKTCKQL